MKRLFLNSIVSLLILSSPCIYAQGDLYSKPNTGDIGFIAGAGIIALSLELGKNYIGPFNPYSTTPNSLDASIRSGLVWKESAHQAASIGSDIGLIMSVSSIAWVPLLIDAPYLNGLMTMSQSVISTFLITDLIKIIAGRQRPYAYYKTLSSKGVDDNYSFLSGHSSMAFAMATTGSVLLGEKYPQLRALIYPLFFLTAAATGYFRLAGDYHYFTDVLAGAFLGAGIGYLTYTWRKPWIQIQPVAGGMMVQKTVYF